MTPHDIVRGAIPDASDDLCSFIVWAMTPFPFRVDAKEIYRAASRAKRAGANGIRICEHCRNRAEPDLWCCARCEAALQAMRDSA